MTMDVLQAEPSFEPSGLTHLPVGTPQFVGALLNGTLGCAAVIDPAGRYLY
ncbi:MAG: hypothetical protein JWS11_2964, partial [Cypionkella sp.]|nr:hypothetical protein [Cypionkella sp.]